MNQKIQQQKKKINMPEHLTHTPLSPQVQAAQASANAAAAGQRREGRGGTHMSRSREQGGLGISQSQAQAVSDANRAAGMSGWGLADGGLIDFYRYGGFSG